MFSGFIKKCCSTPRKDHVAFRASDSPKPSISPFQVAYQILFGLGLPSTLTLDAHTPADGGSVEDGSPFGILATFNQEVDMATLPSQVTQGGFVTAVNWTDDGDAIYRGESFPNTWQAAGDATADYSAVTSANGSVAISGDAVVTFAITGGPE